MKRSARIWLAVLVCLALSSSLFVSQIIRFGTQEWEETPTGPRSKEGKAEFNFVRFRYDSFGNVGGFGRRGRWAMDYPKAERQFSFAIRRLTRIDTEAIDQVVDADSDEIYEWPWVYIEDPGQWSLSPAQAGRLRDYMLRGGFIMADDFHGVYERENFLTGAAMIFPDRPIEPLPDADALLQVLYSIDDRFQVPGLRFLRGHPADARVPEWWCVRDDDGRIMMAISYNSDVGDSWEWADLPTYPERAASLAIRLGINYIIYAMTH
jgi:hypothetical protein